MSKIDTSIEGFAKSGIKITEEKYKDLFAMNLCWLCEGSKEVPVFNIIMLLKYLGLLPKEMIIESDDSLSDFEKLTGLRVKEKGE